MTRTTRWVVRTERLRIPWQNLQGKTERPQVLPDGTIEWALEAPVGAELSLRLILGVLSIDPVLDLRAGSSGLAA